MRSDLLWVLVGRVLTAIIAVASLRIMTTLLKPHDFGIYTLLIAFQSFCGLFLINPVGQHINRNTHAWWDDGTLLKRIARYNYYIIAVSLGIAFVVFVWCEFYSESINSINEAIFSGLAVSAMVYFGTWSGTFVYILNMLGFRSSSVVWMLSSSVIGLIFSSFLSFKYHTGTSWAIGQVLGMALGALGSGIKLRKCHLARKLIEINSRNSSNLLDKKTVLTYCLPLAVGTGLMWLQNTGYRFWVGAVWGPAELGLLAVGLSIPAQIWGVIETLSIQFLNPYFFRHIVGVQSSEKKTNVLSDLVNIMWPVYAVLAGFNFIFASSLLNILTNDSYHDAVNFVFLGVLIEFMRCSANLWSYAAQIELRTAKYILPYGFGAVVVWLGLALLVNMHCKIEMVVYVLAISGLVMCILMVAVMQNILSVSLDWKRWLVSSGILFICVISVFYTPVKVDGFLMHICVTIVGLLVAGGIMLLLLWRNPALSRLLAVSLRRS